MPGFEEDAGGVDDRRRVTRRSDDADLAMWRGEMNACLRIVERDQQMLHDRLERAEAIIGPVQQQLAAFTESIRGLAGKIESLGKEYEDLREADMTSLRGSIHSARNLLVALLAPLFVLIVGSLIVYALTGVHR